MPAANSGGSPDTISLGQIISGELSAAENNRRESRSQRESYKLERAILALCILTNIIFFVTRNDYIVLFVAASFYLNMFYFITLLVPANPGAADLRKPEIVTLIPGTDGMVITARAKMKTVFMGTLVSPVSSYHRRSSVKKEY